MRSHTLCHIAQRARQQQCQQQHGRGTPSGIKGPVPRCNRDWRLERQDGAPGGKGGGGRGGVAEEYISSLHQYAAKTGDEPGPCRWSVGREAAADQANSNIGKLIGETCSK